MIRRARYSFESVIGAIGMLAIAAGWFLAVFLVVYWILSRVVEVIYTVAT